MSHDFATQNLAITPNKRKRERMNTTAKIDYETSSSCCSDACTGDLFPDMLHLERNQLNKGRVFGVLLESRGIGIQDRKIVVDKRAWEECLKSPNFRACYDLSMAKLALQQALTSGCS